MLRRIRITDPAKTFFISDPHFNHKHPEILARRGVASREELDAQSIALWNAAVPPDGTVFMLGDFCLRDPDGKVTRRALKALNGKTIYLMWGNHNSGVKRLYREILTRQFFPDKPQQANNYEVYPVRSSIGANKEVVFVGEYLELLWRQPDGRDHKIVCAHYSHRSWLHGYRGAWMLCGHAHGNDPGTASHGDMGLGKILEVTYETIGHPRNVLEIAAIMAQKPNRAADVVVTDDEDDD